jgi:nucleotide-binding universal stress UspA family protein
LLPLDGSEVSEMALLYGEELARALGSELILFHVRGPERQPEYERIHQVYLERLAETVKLNTINNQSGGKEIKVSVKVETGEPTTNICSLVENNNIDLIIMATVSASGLKIGKMLGSVTDYVCRTVPIPVMLIRPQNIKQNGVNKRLLNRILIPLDGSELSNLALPVGEELAARLGISITLFQMANIIVPYADEMGGTAYLNYAEFNEDELKRVRSEISSLETELRGKGLSADSVVTSGVDAAEEIIEIGKKVGADLTVMSTHGRSGIGRFVFGNVAEKVLRHGEMPLLLVHARAG